jgi:hypothetical protein
MMMMIIILVCCLGWQLKNISRRLAHIRSVVREVEVCKSSTPNKAMSTVSYQHPTMNIWYAITYLNTRNILPHQH